MFSEPYVTCCPSGDAIPGPVRTEYRNKGQKSGDVVDRRRRSGAGIAKKGRRQVFQRAGAVVEAAAGGFHGLGTFGSRTLSGSREGR